MENYLNNKSWSWWPLFPLYPYGKKKTILREIIPNEIWSLEQIQGLYYVAVPIRMTIIKVNNGLMLINPLPPTKELVNALEELISIYGKVKTIVKFNSTVIVMCIFLVCSFSRSKIHL